jgi:hypothetical protein
VRLLVYLASGGLALHRGHPKDHDVNRARHEAAGSEVRDLTGTSLEDVASLQDPRVPPTAQAFDKAYPGRRAQPRPWKAPPSKAEMIAKRGVRKPTV